jgi:hypothetical protein
VKLRVDSSTDDEDNEVAVDLRGPSPLLHVGHDSPFDSTPRGSGNRNVAHPSLTGLTLAARLPILPTFGSSKMTNLRALTKKRIAALASVLVAGTIATVAVANAASTHSAPITKFAGIDESASQCTNAKTFVNLAQAVRSYTIGGTADNEAVAMFSASMILHPHPDGIPDLGEIRLIIDNTLVQTPVDVIALGSTGEQRTVAFNWQTSALPPGTHTARIQWRTNEGSLFCAGARSLIVLSK